MKITTVVSEVITKFACKYVTRMEFQMNTKTEL